MARVKRINQVLRIASIANQFAQYDTKSNTSVNIHFQDQKQYDNAVKKLTQLGYVVEPRTPNNWVGVYVPGAHSLERVTLFPPI